MENNTSKECNDMLQAEAEAELWNLTLCFLKSMALKCAVNLGIPDAIQNHSKPMTLTELHSALSLPPSRKPPLGRLLRMLTHYGFLSECGAGPEAIYDLTATSRLVVNNKDQILACFLRFVLDSIVINSSLFMGDWFKHEDKETPFEIAYGCTLWEMANQNKKLNMMINDAMASISCFHMDFVLRNCGDIFHGIQSLVDVGGGTGTSAKVIAENFTHVECTVLDLPHVVDGIQNDGTVKFVSGDMFKYVPPTDAVFLKWILHDWSDEDCIKILKRCKEAIPSKQDGGKVIIVEMVVGTTLGTILKEPQLLFDILMLTITGGKERDEGEWKKIFEEAGFSSYKIAHTLGSLSIIEIYP